LGPPARGVQTAGLPGAGERSDTACRGPEPLQPAERAPNWAGVPDVAVATRRGTGEEKGGESPGASRGRGGKGAASGGGTKRRSVLSEPSERSARGQQSREAKPTASADHRAERERSWSAGEQGSGERAWVEERRRPRNRGRRAPETLASVPLETVSVSPVGRFSGRLATNNANCREGAVAPGEHVTKRSGADGRGGFPPCFYLCARERRRGRPERTEARRASCGRARRRPGASVPARGPSGCAWSGAEGAAGARAAASDGAGGLPRSGARP